MTYYDGSPAVIVLDPAIRNWVLFPIMVVMILVGILRHYVTSLLSVSSGNAKQDYRETRQMQALHRSINLRRNASHIPPGAVQMRRAYFIDAFKQGKYLKHKPQQGDDANNPMGSFGAPPDAAGMEAMMDGLKKNIAMIVPQTIIMSLINSFFSGFLLIQLPFPLTVRFKSMLQSGINTPDLDASWVSSLSWYFLNLFGLNSIFRLILGSDNAADGTADLTAMNPMAASASSSTVVSDVQMPEMPTPGMMPGAGKSLDKSFQSEAEFLELLDPAQCKWIGYGIEERVLALLQS